MKFRGILGPSGAELCRHDLFRGHRLEQSEVTSKLIHARNKGFRDRRVVIRQVASDQLDDQFGFRRRKQLAADFGCARHIFLKRVYLQWS